MKGLYSSEITHDNLELKAFLDRINIPKLPEALRADLEKDITVEEISAAIDSIKAGKTPPLLQMFIESFENGILP